MSAPAVNVVAWRGATGWTRYHLEYTAELGRTLCMRIVPRTAITQRQRTSDEPCCEGCLAVLDHETMKRLRLTPTDTQGG